ncbi:substrate-binding domain-containing protein [Paenibacillus sp. J2TS4]|uniref:substrate-binding domain-containing protein n=1 Tax=Paenibacillus sp. J2TS4 TaxID=2807194 RepID=UPI001B0E2861|nr:substrate-binding domain-containing protein [Paenibacillus sp. J2TS4]GIP32513.1 sugar ABC transporter substrate-binding protein [Paenibacillus sp. J2TS4]
MNIKKMLGLAMILGIVSVGLLISIRDPMFLFRTGKGKDINVTVVLETTNPRSDFWQTVGAGVRMAAKEYGVPAVIRGMSGGSQGNDQIQLIEDIASSRPDALVIAPLDCLQLEPVIGQLRKSGIPIVTIDSFENRCQSDYLIAMNHIESGEKGGRVLTELLPPDSRVAVIHCTKGQAGPAELERKQGVMQQLYSSAGIKDVQFHACEGDEDQAYELVKQLLAKDTEIGGIVGINDTAALGAGRAIKEDSAFHHVKLVALDTTIYVTKLLEEGVVQAAIVPKPFNIGYLSMQTAVQLARKEKTVPMIEVDTLVATKENMYSQENQASLFPFLGNR